MADVSRVFFFRGTKLQVEFNWREIRLDTIIHTHIYTSCTHLCNLRFCSETGDTQQGCTYRPWPWRGDDVVVASKRWVLKDVFNHIYGIDAHSCGVPEREWSSSMWTSKGMFFPCGIKDSQAVSVNFTVLDVCCWYLNSSAPQQQGH